jgi:hypothetical protein
MQIVENIYDIRLQLLFCIHHLGILAASIIYNDYNTQQSTINALYKSLFAASRLLHVNIIVAAHAKISMNEKNTPSILVVETYKSILYTLP